MNILIIDTETSGLDPETDHLLEIGAVLFDCVSGVAVETYAALVRGAPEVGPEHVHGIPLAALRNGRVRAQVVNELLRLDTRADYIVAHNAAFDRAWLPELAGESWLCSYEAFEWPRGGGRVVDIALAHGVGVVRAHRAIEDCLTLAAVLTRLHQDGHDLVALVERAAEPRVEVRALVSYDDRQLAKDAGFRWDPSRRSWVRSIRASAVDELELPFRVAVTEG